MVLGTHRALASEAVIVGSVALAVRAPKHPSRDAAFVLMMMADG
jgi:hypothetical protein